MKYKMVKEFIEGLKKKNGPYKYKYIEEDIPTKQNGAIDYNGKMRIYCNTSKDYFHQEVINHWYHNYQHAKCNKRHYIKIAMCMINDIENELGLKFKHLMVVK